MTSVWNSIEYSSGIQLSNKDLLVMQEFWQFNTNSQLLRSKSMQWKIWRFTATHQIVIKISISISFSINTMVTLHWWVFCSVYQWWGYIRNLAGYSKTCTTGIDANGFTHRDCISKLETPINTLQNPCQNHHNSQMDFRFVIKIFAMTM